jgi:agmatinase
MRPEDLTFAHLSKCTELETLSADIVIIGIPHGTPYPNEPSGAVNAPTVIRQESIKRWFGLEAWDFDLGGTLLGDSSARVVDCGDLPVEPSAPEKNREITRHAMKEILQAGALPIVLGGDDSVPIMVLRGYEEFGPINVLQIDAHIDWKDEIKNEKEGYSSTMRRISEMPWVDKIIQVGMRGKGSALREDLETGKAYGVQFITANTIHKEGFASVLDLIPEGSAWFISLDVDSLDPSVMPAVGYPVPGGFTYVQLIDLLNGFAKKAKLAGFNLVEFAPAMDVNNLSAITAVSILWNLIGVIVRSPYFKKAVPAP